MSTISKVGFDVDGTLADVPFSSDDVAAWCRGYGSDPEVTDRFNKRYTAAKLIMVPTVASPFMVTARPEAARTVTEAWFKGLCIQYADLICAPHTIRSGYPFSHVDWKARIINEHHIEIYVEDKPEIGKPLSKACPGCDVISPAVAASRGLSFPMVLSGNLPAWLVDAA
jgi:hypothetical protein